MTRIENAEIHVGDVGTRFRLTLEDGDGNPVNIATATVKRLDFRKPDGTTLERAASFLTNGSDGVIYYDTVQGDIDHVGRWMVQPYIEMPGFSGHGAKKQFNVYATI